MEGGEKPASEKRVQRAAKGLHSTQVTISRGPTAKWGNGYDRGIVAIEEPAVIVRVRAMDRFARPAIQSRVVKGWFSGEGGGDTAAMKRRASIIRAHVVSALVLCCAAWSGPSGGAD